MFHAEAFYGGVLGLPKLYRFGELTSAALGPWAIMPVPGRQGVLVVTGGETLGVGLATGMARGTIGDGVGVGFGGSGVAIPSNSVTVTDLNPFLIS